MLREEYSVAIVGGGASGLLCAVELLKDKKLFNKVVILEKNDRVGKKLLATGNGQCNLSNSDLSLSHYYGNKNFIEKFFGIDVNIEKYLYEVGIPFFTDSEGRKYPLSKQASSVLDLIRLYLSDKGCIIKTGFNVSSIKKTANGFIIKTDGQEVFSSYTVIACGGKSARQFGTDGTSYPLLLNFGHKLTELYPSLVQLKIHREQVKGLKGLKERARISAIVNGETVKKTVGDILFTDYGVSGDAVFKISASVCDKENAKIKVEFLPELSSSEVEKIINDRIKTGFINGEDLLNGLINKRIGQSVIRSAKNLSPGALAFALKNYTLNVTGTLGFDYSQVTRGGIVTDDFNPQSMESKLSGKLYAIGEILNVDGDCGGYNLNFAFSSGIVCAKDIKKHIQ